jgi:hypothetical protein
MDKYLIIKELETISDNVTSLNKCVDMMYSIQRSQGPLLEVITILKFEKPNLYSFLKSRLESNPSFKLLFEVSFEYHQAKKSLGIR